MQHISHVVIYISLTVHCDTSFYAANSGGGSGTTTVLRSQPPGSRYENLRAFCSKNDGKLTPEFVL